MAISVTKTGVPPHEYALDILDEVVAAIKDLEDRADTLEAPDPVEVTGARADGTALASLLTVLAGLGLITDSTTES